MVVWLLVVKMVEMVKVILQIEVSPYTFAFHSPLNVITTDEAVIGWNDGTLHEFHKGLTPANEFNNAMYYRIYTELLFVMNLLKIHQTKCLIAMVFLVLI